MPWAPANPCTTPGCPNLRPCPTHPPADPWASANRRRAEASTLSKAEQQRRARKILRIHRGICHVCSEPFADQVDHVIPLAEGGPDTEDNLRPIHARPCHEAKTKREAARGRARARGRPSS